MSRQASLQRTNAPGAKDFDVIITSESLLFTAGRVCEARCPRVCVSIYVYASVYVSLCVVLTVKYRDKRLALATCRHAHQRDLVQRKLWLAVKRMRVVLSKESEKHTRGFYHQL